MAITQVKVARARKINLGNYETTDVFVELTSTVESDVDQTFLDTVNKTDELLDAEVANIVKSKIKR